jgi:asparagine synthase (glutamine-hydrolysing)
MTGTHPLALTAVNWGDILLTFGSTPGTSGRRSSGWIEEARGGGATLWRQDPGAGWRGFPIERTALPDGTAWTVGELSGDAKVRACSLGVATGGGCRSAGNGHFALLGWRHTDRTWHALTDRFGTVHLYVAFDGARACIGTFFPAVAAAVSRRRLDWPALSGFFACGFFPGDRTFFDDVRILRPATHAVFDESGKLLREQRYWQWEHRPDRARGYGDTVAEFGETLHRVLDDETSRGRIAVPISGGLDSRTTVSALTRDGAPARERLWSYSYGYTEDSIETRIGRRVAETRRLPFEPFVVGPYLFERLSEVLACVEGFQDVTQARQAVVTPILAERSDGVIAAHWGDVWLDDMGLEDAAAAPDAVATHAFSKVAKRGRDWLLREIVAPRLSGEDPSAVTRSFVEAELERLSGIEDADFRVKAFKTDQWSFRWTLASLRMYQAGAFPRLPFYDTRLSDFFATVPTAFVAGRRLQIDYLKRFAPDLARIPWQAYGVNLYWQRHFDTWLLPWRAARKFARAFGRGSGVPERNWEVQFSGTGGDALRALLLARGSRIHELVAPAAMERLLDEFAADPLAQGRGYTVSMLLTFARWLEIHA